jgi:hypothetical protein
MTTTIRDFNSLTPEERRRVGQLFSLILTWYQKKQQNQTASAELITPKDTVLIQAQKPAEPTCEG